MALGRFSGQALRRFSDRTLLAGGSAVAAVGCCVVASAPNAAVGLVGFALAGAGISLTAPIVFGIAGRKAGRWGRRRHGDDDRLPRASS